MLGVVNEDNWINKEFKKNKFKDKRLEKRFLKLVNSFSNMPSSSLAQQAEDWAEAKGAYRFFKNDNVYTSDFFSSHQDKTSERASSYPFILGIQDSTTINYQGHSKENGMGPIRNASWGCHLYSTIAVAPNGLFLGVLSNLLWTRDEKRIKKVEGRAVYLEGEERESEKWNEGLLDSLRILKNKTKILYVCDREADSKTFILNCIEYGTDFLIRHSSARKICESHLNSYDYVSQSEIKGSEEVFVTNKWTDNRGKSLRVKSDEGKYERLIKLSYQFVPISIEVSIDSYKKVIPLSIVRIFEDDNSSTDRLEWTLITTLNVKSLEDARAIALYYSLRWRIELFFKTLKSGCRIEKCRLSNFDRMSKFIVLASIIAWRINWVKCFSKISPNAPAEMLLSNNEIEILKKRNKSTIDRLELSLAIKWIARLGGHLNRKGDGAPGIETIWKGFSRLHDIEIGFSL